MADLKNVVEDLCLKAGLLSSEFDVSLLVGDVAGFAISNRASVRTSLENLSKAFFFDMVESNGKIKFVPRGGVVAATISENELVSLNEDSFLEVTRREERELPRTVSIVYLAKDGDYQQATQEAMRQIADDGEANSITIPLVMTGELAKKIADVTLFNMWIENIRFNFSLPRKYFYLEPGDIIVLNTLDGFSFRLRLVKTVLDDQKLNCEALQADDSVYTQTNPPGDDSVSSIITGTPGNTTLLLMDIPMLRDSDNSAGFYAAATKNAAGWKGAQLYQSANNTDYSFAGSLLLSTASGTVATATPIGQPWFIDRALTITVVMRDGQLSSVTEEDLFNGGVNAALLGDEVIQYQTATLIAPKTYRLSNILRGRLGTEDKIAGHTTNERFVSLSSANSNFTRVDSGLNFVNISRYYKAQSIGLALAEATPVQFTNTGRSLRPYSPVQLKTARAINGDVSFSWVRRTRIGGTWTDLTEVPLGELYEKYELDILNDAGTEVLRTIVISTPTAEYTAAEQTIDFGSVKNPIRVKLYQISDTVGRGIAALGNL